MASRWADALPVVTVPRGVDPKAVTFVYPFYDNPRFLARQIEQWWAYPPDLRRYVRAIVVDDGSPLPATLPAERPFPMRLFRIERDVPWNWLAARNIGAHEAETTWLVLTDMDHVIPAKTAEALVFGLHDHRRIYAFWRRESTGAAVTPHSASFFLTRSLFWKIGGYDEALSGHYGTDGDYRRRAQTVAEFRVLTDVLIRHEFDEDSCTTRYRRKLPADAAAVRQLVAARGPGWRPRTLSFAYHEVTARTEACV